MNQLDLLKRLDNIRDELIQTANRHPAATCDLRDIEPWVQEVRQGVEILASFRIVLEDVVLALGCLPSEFPDAYNHVLDRAKRLAGERARIRKELLEAMSAWLTAVVWRGYSAGERQIGAHAAINALQAALDRICPEED